MQVEAAGHPIEPARRAGGEPGLLDERSRLKSVLEVKGDGVGEGPGEIDVEAVIGDRIGRRTRQARAVESVADGRVEDLRNRRIEVGDRRVTLAVP